MIFSILKNLFHRKDASALLPLGSELEIYPRKKTIALKGRLYHHDQLMSMCDDSPLSTFIKEAALPDIQWLIEQGVIRSINLPKLFKNNPWRYISLLRYCFIELHDSDQGKQKFQLLLNIKGAKEVFSENSLENPVLWSHNVSFEKNVTNLIWLFKHYGEFIDLNHRKNEESFSIFEKIIRNSADFTLMRAMNEDKWNIVVLLRHARKPEQYTPRYISTFASLVCPPFQDSHEKEDFIYAKLEEFTQLKQQEAIDLLSSMTQTSTNYMDVYVEHPGKMAQLMLSNPDWFLAQELFKQFCQQASMSSIQALYEQLTQCSIGFFYKRILEKIYGYYRLHKSLDKDPTGKPCVEGSKNTQNSSKQEKNRRIRPKI